MNMKKGTIMTWKKTGKPAFEKMGDNECDWWSSLEENEISKIQYKKDGSLNRYGFKWTDKQVVEYYSSICNFS